MKVYVPLKYIDLSWFSVSGYSVSMSYDCIFGCYRDSQSMCTFLSHLPSFPLI